MKRRNFKNVLKVKNSIPEPSYDAWFSLLKVRKLDKELNIVYLEIDSTDKMIREWTNKYLRKGLEGLKSNTGKHKNPNAGLHLKRPKNKIEELELELMKKEIEIARLKKGYMVKGVGAEKEFVTTFDKNTK